MSSWILHPGDDDLSPSLELRPEQLRAWLEGAETGPELRDELEAALSGLEAATGQRLDAPDRPLLLRLKVLGTRPRDFSEDLDFIGLTPAVLSRLSKQHPELSWAGYAKLLAGLADRAFRIHPARMSRLRKEKLGDEPPSDLESWQSLVACWEPLLESYRDVLQSGREQLHAALEGSLTILRSPRARYAQQQAGSPSRLLILPIPYPGPGEIPLMGTAFSRCPEQGSPGVRCRWWQRGPALTEPLEQPLPSSIAAELEQRVTRLESRLSDLVQVDFARSAEGLQVMSVTPAERSPAAGVRIAVDLATEGQITEAEALRRISPSMLEASLKPRLVQGATRRVIARGVPASAGAVSGRVVFSSEDIERLQSEGDGVILVRQETTPADSEGILLAAGVLTTQGGNTSHAAILARGQSRPCVVGASSLLVDYGRRLLYAGDSVLQEGDWITLDGDTGEVMEGRVEGDSVPLDGPHLQTLMRWTLPHCQVRVRAEADGHREASRARRAGAAGVGLCRTEQMFFGAQALQALRLTLLAEAERERKRAIADLIAHQRPSYHALLSKMDGLPVCIRLLDPPLTSFLPRSAQEIGDLAEEMGLSSKRLRERIDTFHQVNPLLGQRGCRLGLSQPAIYRAQVRALFEAAAELLQEGGDPQIEVVVPMISMPEEMAELRSMVQGVAEEVLHERGVSLDYLIGAMVETPRAALLAGEISAHADFLLLGCNDLTQLTWGISRDDTRSFLSRYRHQGLLESSPLDTLDASGVGQLIQIAIRSARAQQPEIPVGVCGDHAARVESLPFLLQQDLQFVSCSPSRIPVIRLAAAWAAQGWGLSQT